MFEYENSEYIEIDLNETDEKKAHNIIEDMCKKLLVNLIIEEYKINLRILEAHIVMQCPK